ncbi:MAG: hypothetical protein J7556_14845 [Acidovorax sp.]|nr:hypothetical protein [Acidovorax sp.]
MDAALYWLGAAVAFAGALAALAALFGIIGRLLLMAGTYMLRRGLQVIRLSNWYYWNERMSREGLISMQTFYREQAAIHRPKTLQDFERLDESARAHGQQEGAA